MEQYVRHKQQIVQFIKFCIVGAICSGIDAGVFYSVRLITIYQVALASGYLVGLLINYLLTIFWTFKTKPSTKNAIGVVTAHLVNLFVVRMGLMWVFINVIGLSESIAYIPTLVISVVVNFVLVRFAIKITENKEKHHN